MSERAPDYGEVVDELKARARVSPQQLREARQLSQRHARHIEHTSGRFGKSGRREMSVPAVAIKHAQNTEGPEVMSEAAKGYWDDQRRLYPEISGHQDLCVPTGMRNRFGRVKVRITYHGDGSKTVTRGKDYEVTGTVDGEEIL